MSPELRAAFVEQIRRDTETLTDPAHHVEDDPCGRAFYEDRIAAYRAALQADEEIAPAPGRLFLWEIVLMLTVLRVWGWL